MTEKADCCAEKECSGFNVLFLISELKSECLSLENPIFTYRYLLAVTLCPGHASPSIGGAEPSGDKSTTQEGNKSMLVMSGGEGYIDFRMGELGDRE